MSAKQKQTICTVMRLRRATRKATRAYDRHFSQLGIGIAQFGILQTVAMTPQGSISDIASALDMDRTTLTRNLKPLVSGNYVALVDGTDGRSRIVEVTATGHALLKQARKAWAAAQNDLRKRLGTGQTEELHRLLALLLDRLPSSR